MFDLIGVRIIANAFQSDEIVELIEDLGSFPVSVRYPGGVIEVEAVIKKEDMEIISSVVETRKFSGIISYMPLFGIEIVVVLPSFSLHHTPFPHCSIVEVLRQAGADVNTISLARGVGRRAAMISKEEKKIIEEHDVAVFLFGCFEDCIKNYKLKMCESLRIPVIATGYADIEEEGIKNKNIRYVRGIGRIPTMFSGVEDKKAVYAIGNAIIPIIHSLRPEIEDILAYMKMEIEYLLPEAKPVKIKMNGLRVNLPFDSYAEKIADLDLYFGKLREKALVRRGFKGDTLIMLRK
ncbi:MAG: methyl-coenzyme M reductase family protein [Candidatus Methanospirareceae archaeon]